MSDSAHPSPFGFLCHEAARFTFRLGPPTCFPPGNLTVTEGLSTSRSGDQLSLLARDLLRGAPALTATGLSPASLIQHDSSCGRIFQDAPYRSFYPTGGSVWQRDFRRRTDGRPRGGSNYSLSSMRTGQNVMNAAAPIATRRIAVGSGTERGKQRVMCVASCAQRYPSRQRHLPCHKLKYRDRYLAASRLRMDVFAFISREAFAVPRRFSRFFGSCFLDDRGVDVIGVG
jgi:hypothetical protein